MSAPVKDNVNLFEPIYSRAMPTIGSDQFDHAAKEQLGRHGVLDPFDLFREKTAVNTKHPKHALTRAAKVGVRTIFRIPKWIGYSGGPFFSSSNLLSVTLMVAKDVLISFN